MSISESLASNSCDANTHEIGSGYHYCLVRFFPVILANALHSDSTVHMHAYVYTYIHVHIHTYMSFVLAIIFIVVLYVFSLPIRPMRGSQLYTCMHMYIRTYMYTHTHTYIYIYEFGPSYYRSCCFVRLLPTTLANARHSASTVHMHAYVYTYIHVHICIHMNSVPAIIVLLYVFSLPIWPARGTLLRPLVILVPSVQPV